VCPKSSYTVGFVLYSLFISWVYIQGREWPYLNSIF
jgi:hypothetical protein